MSWTQEHRQKRTGIIAAELKKFPDISARTLGRKLHDKHPLLFTSLENARNAVRQYTGNSGSAKDRERAKRLGRYRPPRKPGELPPLPEEHTEPWEPYIFDVVGEVGVISDLHIPYQKNKAIEVTLEKLDTIDLAGILINGDMFDFYQGSRWSRIPTEAGIKTELEEGRKFFAHLRARYGDIPIVLKEGNHEERLADFICRRAPELYDVPGFLQFWHEPSGINEHNIIVVGDQRPIYLGKLPVLHGHEKGKGITSPVNQARGAFMRIGESVLEGHGHRSSGHSEPTGLSDVETMCWSAGCLCDRSPRYARINKWNWGFAIVTVHESGEYDVRNLRISKDYKVRES